MYNLNTLSLSLLLAVMATLPINPLLLRADTLQHELEQQGLLIDREVLPAPTPSYGDFHYDNGVTLSYPEVGVTSKLNLLLQNRYSFSDFDQPSNPANRSSFNTSEARIELSGTALYEEFQYVLETNFVAERGEGENSPNIEDAYIEWSPCVCSSLTLGHFQTPLGRQNENVDYLQHFADKAIASLIFDQGSQHGVGGEYEIIGKQLIGSASLFNGLSSGENSWSPAVDTKHVGFASLRLTPLDDLNIYSEEDLDWNESLALSWGATYGYEEATQELFGTSEDLSLHLINTDLSLKYRGYSLSSEFFIQDGDPTRTGQQTGFYVQNGYFISPKKLEVALRYSKSDCVDTSNVSDVLSSECGEVNSIEQSSAGVSYFIWSHNFKIQLNYDRLEFEGGDHSKTDRWLIQSVVVL